MRVALFSRYSNTYFPIAKMNIHKTSKNHTLVRIRLSVIHTTVDAIFMSKVFTLRFMNDAPYVMCWRKPFLANPVPLSSLPRWPRWPRWPPHGQVVKWRKPQLRIYVLFRGDWISKIDKSKFGFIWQNEHSRRGKNIRTSQIRKGQTLDSENFIVTVSLSGSNTGEEKHLQMFT